MRERPILFSGEMVRALLDGRKTQTRRMVKAPLGLAIPSKLNVRIWDDDQPAEAWWPIVSADGTAACNGFHPVKCRYGRPGDRLWVRETFCMAERIMSLVKSPCYRATEGEINPTLKWKPAIHMPRAASRINLEITGVRVERLLDISEADAQAEGIDMEDYPPPPDDDGYIFDYRAAYSQLWEKINGAGAWDKNPWAWIIEFKRVTL